MSLARWPDFSTPRHSFDMLIIAERKGRSVVDCFGTFTDFIRTNRNRRWDITLMTLANRNFKSRLSPSAEKTAAVSDEFEFFDFFFNAAFNDSLRRVFSV